MRLTSTVTAHGSRPATGDFETVEQWKHSAEATLQNKTCVSLRNREITANYARAYLKHPRLYKWASMAAFASHHVRLALKPFALSSAPRQGDQPQGERRRMRDDVQVIKDINDAIFNDIYWAHMAYDGSAEGLAKIELAVGDDPQYASLLSSFRKLEDARQIFEESPGSNAAEELVWQANIDILWHEQTAMVQPRFEKLGGSFARTLSLFSTMHYQSRGRCKKVLLPGAFMIYMLLNRPKAGSKRRGFPCIANLDHRWEWILNALVPSFRCYEIERAAITSDLEKLIP